MLHSARKLSGEALFERLYLRIYFPDQPDVVVYFDPEDLCEKCDVFLYRQILVERKPARHISDNPAYLPAVANGVKAADFHISGIRQHERCRDAHHGGLSRSVRPDQPEYFALGGVERNSAERGNSAVRPLVGLEEAGDFYRAICHLAFPLRRIGRSSNSRRF